MTDKNTLKVFKKYLKQIDEIITKQGFVVQPVISGEDLPSYAYSIGLTDMSHPELFMTGYAPDYMQGLLNDLAVKVKKGEVLPINTPYKYFETADIMFCPVVRGQDEYLKGIKRRYDKADNVLQVVIPDENCYWPWDPRCNPRVIDFQLLLCDEPKLN